MFSLREHTKYCKNCRKRRLENFRPNLEKEKAMGGDFSPFFEGFSSSEKEVVNGPTDFLVVSESIGNLEHHLRKLKQGKKPTQLLKDYYLNDSIETFNQWATRKILMLILNNDAAFYFTDVVKCYVNKKSKKNFETAVDLCAEGYLKDQIKLLKPKTAILLGRTAEKIFLKFYSISKRLQHGEIFHVNEISVIFSEFPGRMNVDRFFGEGGIVRLKKALLEI